MGGFLYGWMTGRLVVEWVVDWLDELMNSEIVIRKIQLIVNWFRF